MECGRRFFSRVDILNDNCPYCALNKLDIILDKLALKKDELKALGYIKADRLKEAQEIALDLFQQACYCEQKGFIYDHMCLSANENAQAYLIENDLIKESECSRRL